MAYHGSAERPPTSPDLRYLLQGDPDKLVEALAGMRSADAAEALRDLPPGAAGKVLAALPVDLARRVLDEPELEGRRCAIIQQMSDSCAAPLIEAMSSDQRVDLFRELPPNDRSRFVARRNSSKLVLTNDGPGERPS